MTALRRVLSADALVAILGWRATEARWQAFWDRWSNGQIRPGHWQKRDADPFELSWFGGELQLVLTYEPGTLTVPETWALRSVTLLDSDGSPHRLAWGSGIVEASCELTAMEAHFRASGRRHRNGASFFVSRPDGVELAIQLDWKSGFAGPLARYAVAAMGVPKG